MGGDFNDWRSLVQPASRLSSGFARANGGDSGAERRVKTYPSFFPQGPLDRIYFRGPFRLLAARPCRLGLCRVASDHLPLVADLEIHSMSATDPTPRRFQELLDAARATEVGRRHRSWP